MPEARGYLKALLNNLRRIRERAALSPSALEERLILGPGWINRFETGETVPSIDMVLALLHETGGELEQLLEGLPDPEASEVERCIFAEEAGDNIIINFRYANFDAQYKLANSTLDDFEAVIKTLRDGLARLANFDQSQSEAIKTDSVARTFLIAVNRWPHVSRQTSGGSWCIGPIVIRITTPRTTHASTLHKVGSEQVVGRSKRFLFDITDLSSRPKVSICSSPMEPQNRSLLAHWRCRTAWNPTKST